IGEIRGVGELTVYDISHRIGAHFGNAPQLVHLHAGTRTGARAFGIRGGILDPKTLPHAFSRLTPAEIEDCLCIYKDVLRGKGALRSESGCAVAEPSQGCRVDV